MDDDRAVMGESVAKIRSEREGQARIDEHGHRDAADGVGHGGWSGYFDEFDLRNVRAKQAGALGPVAAKDHGVPALSSYRWDRRRPRRGYRTGMARRRPA